jgi:type VI secretion system protein ImpA
MSITVNVEELIKPIAEDSAVGVNLRQDNAINALYYQMKDLRNAARDLERRQSMGQDLELNADWRGLAKLCVTALTEKTKDLEIASWLIEALVRLEGFAGLCKGVQVMSALTKNYWDTIYPLPDEDGLETRLAPIVSLNGDEFDGTLIAPIAQVDITQGNSVGPYALWQYQQAIENGKITEKTTIAKRREQGSVFLDDIKVAVAESSASFYQALNKNLADCKAAYHAFDEILIEQCAEQKPSSSKILQALDNFADHVRFITKDTPFALATAPQVEAMLENPEEEKMEIALPVASATPNNVSSRDEALQQLAKLADFFRRTEPQSPLPYLLERAQQLGRLSFTELLKELVDDESARNAAYKLMGLRIGEAE